MRVINILTWMVILVLPRQEIVDWFMFVGAIGAAVFSWGLGNYQKYRATRRKEDDEDRKAMHQSVLELQRELDKLDLQVKSNSRSISDTMDKTD